MFTVWGTLLNATEGQNFEKMQCNHHTSLQLGTRVVITPIERFSFVKNCFLVGFKLMYIFCIGKKWPEGSLKACHRGKIVCISQCLFAFYNAITPYNYLIRNPKFTMETVN